MGQTNTSQSAELRATEQGFPRIYRMDARGLRVVNGFLLVFTSFFLFFTVRDLARFGFHSRIVENLIVVDSVVALWVALIGSTYNKRAILHQDTIEVGGWFYDRKLTFAEIHGRQTTGSSRIAFPYAYVLMPSDKNKRKLVLPGDLHTDQFFRDWIKAIPKIPRRKESGS